MDDKNVVSIEDRIPKLKQARKKKANRRLIFYLSIFFILISIVIYLQSPLSHVHNIEITGNQYIEDDEVKKLSELSKDDNFWNVNKKEIKSRIEEHPEISSIAVSKTFPTTVSIHVEELQRVGYVREEGTYYPLLENGKRLESYPLTLIQGDAPLLTDFTKQTYLQDMTKEMQNLPKSIINLISEIYWRPSEGNPYRIWLYMNDGYEVEASIRNFSNTMKAYPSIVSQIDVDSKGVIHMGDGGAVFNPYKNPAEENEDETER